jgi:hypothetical protein
MSGKKGRSGRKPAPKNLIDRMLEKSEPQLPDIWQGLVDLAKGVKIGTANENGEVVNVYSKPPDKEAIAEITNRHFGRPKIELDQRFKGEFDVTPDPSRVLQAMRELETNRAEFLQLPEREPSPAEHDSSHAPDVAGSVCEETISQTINIVRTRLIWLCFRHKPQVQTVHPHNVDGFPQPRSGMPLGWT